MAHHRVWLFRPPTGREKEFSDAYAADGAWATLFRRASGYIGTRLLRPAEPGGWWMTIDSWTDARAFEGFQSKHRDEYRALDWELEGIAGEESFVGAFDDQSRSGAPGGK